MEKDLYNILLSSSLFLCLVEIRDLWPMYTLVVLKTNKIMLNEKRGGSEQSGTIELRPKAGNQNAYCQVYYLLF